MASGTAVLTAGTVTVADTKITISSVIRLRLRGREAQCARSTSAPSRQLRLPDQIHQRNGHFDDLFEIESY